MSRGSELAVPCCRLRDAHCAFFCAFFCAAPIFGRVECTRHPTRQNTLHLLSHEYPFYSLSANKLGGTLLFKIGRLPMTTSRGETRIQYGLHFHFYVVITGLLGRVNFL